MLFKPNQVVSLANSGYFVPGRISRVIAPDLYEVVDCGGHIKLYNGHEIVIAAYKGFYDDKWGIRAQFPVYRRMKTLRQLKRHCAKHDPTVWKKNRRIPLSEWSHLHRESRKPGGAGFTMVVEIKGTVWFSGIDQIMPNCDAIRWCHDNGIRYIYSLNWLGIPGSTEAMAFRLRWC